MEHVHVECIMQNIPCRTHPFVTKECKDTCFCVTCLSIPTFFVVKADFIFVAFASASLVY